MTTPTPHLKWPNKANISPEDYQLIQQLRDRSPAHQPVKMPLTLGAKLADRVAATVGSWKFVIIQSSLLAIWIILNVIGIVAHWDPYPFILLNLALSFQAAYTAPIIMMSQNRQSQIDRQDAKYDYEVNLKSELEIELLHDKMSMLRNEIVEVLNHVRSQQESLQELNLIKLQQAQLDRIEEQLKAILRHNLT